MSERQRANHQHRAEVPHAGTQRQRSAGMSERQRANHQHRAEVPHAGTQRQRSAGMSDQQIEARP
ncbi:hypothetical protein [Micromonospora musae]|uniref:hypothetical protein n=1 Tax=Micromonospora musae TaxID=1894970 RepID=UPI003413D32D